MNQILGKSDIKNKIIRIRNKCQFVHIDRNFGEKNSQYGSDTGQFGHKNKIIRIRKKPNNAIVNFVSCNLLHRIIIIDKSHVHEDSCILSIQGKFEGDAQKF